VPAAPFARMSTINLTVRIPEGLTEGQSFQVPTPSGETIIARVPAGYRGGMTINVAVPPSASAVAKPAAVAQPAVAQPAVAVAQPAAVAAAPAVAVARPAAGVAPVQPVQPVIIHGGFYPWLRTPQGFQCQFCSYVGVTRISHEIGAGTCLMSGGLALVGCVWGCCLIPCCVDEAKDVVHHCPNCQRIVGVKPLIG